MREFFLDPKTRRTDCLNGYGIQWRSFTECYLDSTGTFPPRDHQHSSDAREAGADSAVGAHQGGTGTCAQAKVDDCDIPRDRDVLCGSSQCILDEVKMARSLDLCPTVPVMVERSFVVLRDEGKVPTMASCTKCQHKFFTPAQFAGDAVIGERYLTHKFDLHRCPEDEGSLWPNSA
jgi:hypothetical protein